MTVRLVFAAALLSVAMAGSACAPKSAALPAPQEPTADSVAYFCGMNLSEHTGPKGQAFVAGRKEPLWFSSARDAIAFIRLPEQPERIVVVYVNDMARATDWDRPQVGDWVRATDAWYVIGSKRKGGMGASEAVPFSLEGRAKAFTARYGGRVVHYADIPDSYVLGSRNSDGAMPGMASATAGPAAMATMKGN